jgi:hypothetical protein
VLCRSLSSLSSSPALYVTWALTVVAALCVTYFSNPYVFGFTALALLASACPAPARVARKRSG